MSLGDHTTVLTEKNRCVPTPSPLRAEAALTSRCNLRCRYCHFFGSAGEKKRELDTAEWLGIFDELGAMKVMELTLTGGEVLLREDLPELIAGIRRNNMRFLLLSNGFAFEERHAAMLKESGRCVYVQISIDGPEAAHDLARGSGTYARAVRAMELVRRCDLPLTVRMTVGRHNFRLLPETARLRIEENNVRALTCNPAFHFAGKKDESDLPWIMSRREFLTALSDALATAGTTPNTSRFAAPCSAGRRPVGPSAPLPPGEPAAGSPLPLRRQLPRPVRKAPYRRRRLRHAVQPPAGCRDRPGRPRPARRSVGKRADSPADARPRENAASGVPALPGMRIRPLVRPHRPLPELRRPRLLRLPETARGGGARFRF